MVLTNAKLPATDRTNVQNAIAHIEQWLTRLTNIRGTSEQTIADMVAILNDYKFYIDINLIFDSQDDFLYRQKGQLKLDNSIIEEFLPILITTVLSNELGGLDLTFGPTNSFSAIRFESNISVARPGGGMTIRSKDQDFAISKTLYIRASHKPDFQDAVTAETHIAYVAAECKTNLDKTMFQEAGATALDVKTAVPGAKYYLLCEWLDMTPISTSTTAIDEIIILRKCRRIAADVRGQFNTVEGRKRYRDSYIEFLKAHPFPPDTLARLVNHIRALFHDDAEDSVLERGYF